ncbi:MAG TPA: PIN domain-containing protein [Tepidisphaeraceae bacterium]|nr:PIN domain-containing protein [Tepidisphaeraceae bacterium]
MRYLLDSSVWLEALLDQAQAGQVVEFLSRVPLTDLAVTDFAIYSIALKMIRHDRRDRYLEFANDILCDGGVTVVRPPPAALSDALAAMASLNLDFDDAIQYLAAERNGLTLVSFDHHFDATPRGRQTPADVTPPAPAAGI